MERSDALALLESHHAFPGPFAFRVVVPPDKKELTVSAMSAAAGRTSRVVHIGERLSRNGNYLALQVRMEVASAHHVLEVYDVLKSFDYVLATL